MSFVEFAAGGIGVEGMQWLSLAGLVLCGVDSAICQGKHALVGLGFCILEL